MRRWTQLAIMVACTVMLGNLQYSWTLFVTPMHNATHWAVASIQVAFSIMIFLNTWLAPIEGWIVDRHGPRFVVMLGGAAAALCWAMNARAQSLPMLYAAGAIGGISLGCVFGTCMGSALKWFPDRRGFASGMIAAGYGLGPAAMAAPIIHMIRTTGYRDTFLLFGTIQGAAIFLLAALLVKPVPPPFRPSSARILQGAEFTPVQTVRTGVFWAIYLVYVLIGSGGMIITAQLGPIAHDLGIAAPVLTAAIVIDNLANGITRPLCGFLSDRIGRENAMLLIFVCEGLAFAAMAAFGRQPAAFVVSAALIFLFWGEIFSVFPAICGDTFGVRNATANNGLLYTAKGTCSLAVPIASVLVGATGTWMSVLIAASVSSVAAGLLAKLLVAPMRRKLLVPAPAPVTEFAP